MPSNAENPGFHCKIPLKSGSNKSSEVTPGQIESNIVPTTDKRIQKINRQISALKEKIIALEQKNKI